MSKRIEGYIRWIDGDKGTVSDFEGNTYFANEWSFEDTVYVVTGICKVTGKEKTIETRHFPGLFLGYRIKPGATVEAIKYKHNIPCRFEQAEGIDHPWAVKITLAPDLQDLMNDHSMVCALDAMLACDLGHEPHPGIWRPHAENRLKRLLDTEMVPNE